MIDAIAGPGQGEQVERQAEHWPTNERRSETIESQRCAPRADGPLGDEFAPELSELARAIAPRASADIAAAAARVPKQRSRFGAHG
jgi:hypothetical protein